jgi:DinB superfamily
MRLTICVLAALLLAAPVLAQSLKQGERDRALSELYVGRKQFLDSIAALTEAQWNFKPAPNVWSIAECAEHIAASEDLLLESLPKLMQSPAQPQKRAEAANRDEVILKGMLDRSHKAQAPEVLQPKRRWPNRDELAQHFQQSRDRTLDYVRSTQDDLRDHFTDHPIFKTVDAYQLILMMAAHTERHTMQLNEVKQAPGFPK